MVLLSQVQKQVENDKEEDEANMQIITLEKISAPEEQDGPHLIPQEDKGDSSDHRIPARPSGNICLTSDLNNTSTSFNQELAKKQPRNWKGCRTEQTSS